MTIHRLTVYNLSMAGSWPVAEDVGRAARLQRRWVRALGRVCLWLSVAAVTLTLLGFGAFAVVALAHHAAPAGGGG